MGITSQPSDSARATLHMPALLQRQSALAVRGLESRYRSLLTSLVRLRRSRRFRSGVGAGYGLIAVALAALTARHFAAAGWPLASARPGPLVAAGVLLLAAQALKALGWWRLFGPDDRP